MISQAEDGAPGAGRAGAPAAMVPRTRRRTGFAAQARFVSAEFTAKPSIAELSKDGTLSGLKTSRAEILPTRDSTRTVSWPLAVLDAASLRSERASQ